MMHNTTKTANCLPNDAKMVLTQALQATAHAKYLNQPSKPMRMDRPGRGSPTILAEALAFAARIEQLPRRNMVTLRVQIPSIATPPACEVPPTPDSKQAAWELKVDAMEMVKRCKFDEADAMLTAVERAGVDVKKERILLVRERTAYCYDKDADLRQTLARVEELIAEAKTTDTPGLYRQAHAILDELEVGDRLAFWPHRSMVAKASYEARKQDQDAILAAIQNGASFERLAAQHKKRWGPKAARDLDAAHAATKTPPGPATVTASPATSPTTPPATGETPIHDLYTSFVERLAEA